MKQYIVNFAAAWLLSGLVLASNSAYGESHPYDFQANAKMVHKLHGPVDNAYGLINVVSDNEGKGVIDVMFSNGSQIDWVKFNARVKFLNASGSVISEQHFYRWLDAAGEDGAAERKLSKRLAVTGFETIEVEFYLTDMPESGIAHSEGADKVRVSAVNGIL